MLLEILLVILMMNLLLDVRTITFIDYMLLVDKSYAGGVLPSKPFIVLVFLVVDVFPRSTDECLHTIGVIGVNGLVPNFSYHAVRPL